MCQWWSAEILTNCINSHLLKPLCRRLISLPSLHYLMKHISFLMQPMPVIQSVCTNLSPLLFIPYVDPSDCIFGTQIWIFQHWQKECTMCVLYTSWTWSLRQHPNTKNAMNSLFRKSKLRNTALEMVVCVCVCVYRVTTKRKQKKIPLSWLLICKRGVALLLLRFQLVYPIVHREACLIA